MQPVLKRGDPNDYDNYMAISLLTENSLLSPCQHGFIKSRSTQTALCNYHYKIVKALDDKEFVVRLSIDLSRAFDMVDHELLLSNRYQWLAAPRFHVANKRSAVHLFPIKRRYSRENEMLRQYLP
ncbi:hypothetical protein QE152_g23770 [Popillia japonica]|uniref:Reverse transcriptase domain-containing protein n=1 Tax=Popillia japonica TaxID=7064 RepID=A0AAW1KFY8_POPJA